MSDSSLVDAVEDELRTLADQITDPGPDECLVCYVHRMLEFGCHGLRWATRFRDVRAPRATALAGRLASMGGFCDCEIFFNAYEPHPDLLGYDAYGEVNTQPIPMPACQRVRRGSTQPCSLWVRIRRWC